MTKEQKQQLTQSETMLTEADGILETIYNELDSATECALIDKIRSLTEQALLKLKLLTA